MFAARINGKDSEETACAAIDMLESEECRTFTFDNGNEFAMHIGIGMVLDAKCYFAHPYHPWERGTNENTNGLLREFLPKGTDFRELTQQQLDDYVSCINNRPRKCLNWDTPNNVYYSHKYRCT